MFELLSKSVDCECVCVCVCVCVLLTAGIRVSSCVTETGMSRNLLVK